MGRKEVLAQTGRVRERLDRDRHGELEVLADVAEIEAELDPARCRRQLLVFEPGFSLRL